MWRTSEYVKSSAFIMMGFWLGAGGGAIGTDNNFG